MKETAVYERVRRAFGPSSHVVRFTDRFNVGIPDMNVCVDGVEYWIECKVGKLLKGGWVKVDLSLAQALWLEDRVKAGGRCRVAVAVGKELYWWHGPEFRPLLEKHLLYAFETGC